MQNYVRLKWNIISEVLHTTNVTYRPEKITQSH